MSKNKEIPIRKCIVTGARCQKAELLRIVRIDGVAVIDLTGTRAGRGAYVMPHSDVIKKAKKKNAIARALRMKVDTQIYDELLEMVGEAVD